ncbi:MAG: hypothetical protein QOI12_3169 [Alphaproteobacteria bacterium]|nr:hypothetical protein [Alphaproteobacteria bacterium]
MAGDRATYQRLAELRLHEAKLLGQGGHPSGAYYLAGYAIECALKARIAAQFREHEIPDKALVNRIYTHDLAIWSVWRGLSQNCRPPSKPILSFLDAGPSPKNGLKSPAILFGLTTMRRI